MVTNIPINGGVNNLTDQLLRDEGLRLKPYVDTVGKTTIGAGRNLTDKGISKDEAIYLLSNDINEVADQLNQVPWIAALEKVEYIRWCVLANMAFNMGTHELLKWNHFLGYIAQHKWVEATHEAITTPWAKEVGQRSNRLMEQLITGEWR